MTESQFWRHQGIRRIMIILLIIYSAVMIIGPSFEIREFITVDDCIGAKDYIEKQRQEYIAKHGTRGNFFSPDDIRYAEDLAEQKFRIQLSALRWGWLLLNIAFWPFLVLILIKVLFWIQRGFAQSKGVDTSLAEGPLEPSKYENQIKPASKKKVNWIARFALWILWLFTWPFLILGIEALLGGIMARFVNAAREGADEEAVIATYGLIYSIIMYATYILMLLGFYIIARLTRKKTEH